MRSCFCANPRRLRSGLVLLLLLLPIPVRAQPPKPLVITDKVQVGFPGGPQGERHARLGAWAPVYVELKTPGKDEYRDEWSGVGAGDFELVVQASDGNSVGQYIVKTPALAPGERRTVLTYYRPGDRSGQFKLLLRKAGGSIVSEVPKDPSFTSIFDPNDVFYLAIGGQFGGLREAMTPAKQEGSSSRSQKRLAVINSVDELPAHWIGYQGVDVVALSTFDDRFLTKLVDSPAAPALGEWVRRGGRLILTVGRNHQLAKTLFQRLGLKPEMLTKGALQADLTQVKTWVGLKTAELPAGNDAPTTRLELKDVTLALANAKGGESKSWPVLALAPLGTGRVFLIGFDTETVFPGWPSQTGFWRRVHDEMGPRDSQGTGRQDGRNELGTQLQRGLESFDEVPVISFGWVAFFILIYILIVGPLDYWFLKKVVKRLELTWITFPLVVLVVSVAAYFTAYRIKGHHLRINKVDVIDISLSPKAGPDSKSWTEVQGTTWLALFSPRVQAYTVGIEPVPEWGGATDPSDNGTVVRPLNAPDSSIGGLDRPTSMSLFRRPYQFADNASGLKNVPVPVWASRSFTASWRTRVPQGKLIRLDEFGLSRDGQRLVGTIESSLPVELTEASLFYRGRWHPLPQSRLQVGRNPVEIRIESDSTTVQWMQEPFRAVYSPRLAAQSSYDAKRSWRSPEDIRVSSLIKEVLFHSRDSSLASQSNSGLRALDQGWRLREVPVVVGPKVEKRPLDEVILIGRAVQPPAAAEAVSQDGVSPTRVWLGNLPGEGEREKLLGFLGQDTYVRIYIPVPRERN